MVDEYEDWRMEATAEMPKADGYDDDTDPVPVEDRINEETGLITVAPQSVDHHVITGMAALARMDDAQYEDAIGIVTRGMERVKDFQKRAMIKGEDYGVVKGIDRPFLHLPGAEKLCLLYGLAVRQEADRIVGEKDEKGVWTSPPLAYHVRSYVHLGSFDGPIVGMGYGEANSWEVKYRYTWQKAKCPACNHDLIRGKPDGKLKGKYWCPSREGGCNRTFEPNDPNIAAPGKVETDDPYSLAETLVQMAAKRSFVAATRRATGTSGLFTQDEDSPSVQSQAEPESDDSPAPVTAVDAGEVERGGKPTSPTEAQIAYLAKISKDKDLGPDGIVAAIERLELGKPDIEGDDRASRGRALLAWIRANLSADQLGALLHHVETGEISA